MRSFAAIAIIGVLASFLQAPMTHTHALASDDDHHAAERAHAHRIQLPAHSSNAAWEQLDGASDERAASWFVSRQAHYYTYAIATEPSLIVEPPRTVEPVRAAPSLRSHDPPQLRNFPPRAPPLIPA